MTANGTVVLVCISMCESSEGLTVISHFAIASFLGGNLVEFFDSSDLITIMQSFFAFLSINTTSFKAQFRVNFK